MKKPLFFLELLSNEDRIKFYKIVEQWPQVLSFFHENHIKKEQAFAQGDTFFLKEMVEYEKKQLEKLFREVLPLIEDKE